MEVSEYDETRATARLPNLDIEILHCRPWEGNEEHLMVTLGPCPPSRLWAACWRPATCFSSGPG